MPADTRRGRRPGPDRRRVPTTARPGRAWPGVAPCRARESWARPSPCRLASWASERSASRACPLEGGAPRRVTGAELQTDADDVDGTLGQRQPAQPHPVLLGGHEPDRLQRRGSLFEPAQVVGLVPIVVGESHERGGLHAELAEGGLEAGGCCDAGEREHARPGEITQPMRTHALGLPALDGAMTGGQHGHAGSVNVRGRAHLAEIRLAAGAGGDDELSARERRQRLGTPGLAGRGPRPTTPARGRPSSAVCTAIPPAGVLPVPPTVRLPMAMTGRPSPRERSTPCSYSHSRAPRNLR